MEEKKLEEKIREFDSKKELSARNVKMAQVQLSDEIVKNQQLQDKLDNLETEVANLRKELGSSNRLHGALICLQRLVYEFNTSV